MSYKSWIESHGKKHKDIVVKLSHLSDNEIIEYFRFENMKEREPDFCPLYKDNTKCHDIENLNCYLCACPNFKVSKDKSYCDIKSVDGSSIVAKDGYVHQDCSKCIVPHKEKYIQEYFDRDWINIMKNTI